MQVRRRGLAIADGAAIRAERERQKLSTTQLAAKANCSAQMIVSVETGWRNLSLQTAIAVAAALDVPLTAIAKVTATDADIAAATGEVA
jgi:transcriptional regulator with XRE-family HTH domain